MWSNFKLNHYHKYKLKKIRKKNKNLNEGNYGLKVIKSGFINPNELKTIIFYLKKILKKQGKIWINLNPNFTKTKKPIETRMGKGKGNLVGYYCTVQRGHIFLEIFTKSDQLSIQLLKKIKLKISLPTKIVKNNL